MSFLAHSSFTILTRWAGYLLEGVASILVARSVGPAGKGMLAVLNVLGGLALQMGNLGLHAAGTHFAAREPEALPRIAWTSLVLAPTIGGVLAAGLGAAVLAFPGLVPHVPWPLVVLTLLGIPFAFLLLFFQNILLGQRRIGAYNTLDLGAKGLTVPLVLLVLYGFSGGVPELVAAGLLVSVAVAGIAIRLAFQGIATPFVFDRPLLGRMLRYGVRSYLSCLLAYLIIRSDMLLVNYFLGPAAAGVYAVAVNLTDLLLVFPVAIGTMLFPRVSAVPDDPGSLTARACRHTGAGMLLLSAGAAAAVDPAIRLLYGEAFRGAAVPFLILLPGVLALSLEMLFMNDLAGRGLPPVVIAVPAVGLALNLALNLALLPRFGLAAAAASSTAAYGVMLLLAWRAFARRTSVPLRACCLLTAADLGALRLRLRALLAGGTS